jgi:formylglycine-generating enzyme
MKLSLIIGILFFNSFLSPTPAIARESEEFADKVNAVHGLSGESARRMKKLLMDAPRLTRNISDEDPRTLQGPRNSWHMTTRQACLDKVIATGLLRQDPQNLKLCGHPWMVPVAAKGKSPDQAKFCIDQFEFPNIPCEYPVAWSTSAIANNVCRAMGKRACNSHEWEGACQGFDAGADSYKFSIQNRAQRRLKVNSDRPITFAYSARSALKDTRKFCGVYSPQDPEIASPMNRDLAKYYTGIGKSVGCQKAGSDYDSCGSNTWPSGFKFECRTQSGVFDLHGNVAEVTNLPESEVEIAGTGGHLGGTERKGSFFVYRSDYPDDCRVRQPYEHSGPYATDGMGYYQEGFRCCKDL